MESKKTMTQLTEQQIEAQIEKAIATGVASPFANSTQIDADEPKANEALFEDGRIIIHFDNGAIFSVMPSSVEELASLSPEAVATILSNVFVG
jgi:sugar-specific transcriptional regulator TrmB